MLETAKKLCALVNKYVEYFVAALLATATVSIFFQVFCRFILNTGFAWTEELSRFLFVWIGMLGTSICVYRRANLGIETFINMLSPDGRRRCWVLINGLVIILFCFLVYYGAVMIPVVSVQESPSLNVTMAIPYFGVFLGALLTLLHLTIQFWDGMVNREDVQ